MSVPIASESVFRVRARSRRRPGSPRDVNIWYRVSGRASAWTSRSPRTLCVPELPSRRIDPRCVTWTLADRSIPSGYPRPLAYLPCLPGAAEPQQCITPNTRVHGTQCAAVPLGTDPSGVSSVTSLVRLARATTVVTRAASSATPRPACREHERPRREFCDRFHLRTRPFSRRFASESPAKTSQLSTEDYSCQPSRGRPSSIRRG